MYFKSFIVSLALIALQTGAHAQDLLSSVADSAATTEKVSAAFKSTRVIQAHSIEMLKKGSLDFRILHRFGMVSTGAKQLFGLDNAYMRLSFDYGITDNFTVGVGRSTFRKEIDLFVKGRLLQQTTGAKVMPVSLALAVGGAVRTEESFEPIKPGFSERSSYYVQLLVGRKFNSRFSFQLSPIVLHSGQVITPGDEATIFALGAGARYKVSKRIAITADYHHPFTTRDAIYTDPLGIGVDIETGGHVFQLHFSNAVGMNERAYLTQTTGQFFEGDIRFGFNLSRIFQVNKRSRANSK